MAGIRRQETQAKVVIIHLKENKMDKVVGGEERSFTTCISGGHKNVVYLG
jgi:hypothetical protein